MSGVAPLSKHDILIYAELLTNIRQITVKTSLPTPADHTTTAEIFEGRKFRISHNGVTDELDLPAAVLVKGPLPLSQRDSTELTWRLPLPPVRVPERQFLPENQLLPWSASDIKPGSPVSCRGCGQSFVAHGAINVWKDLPSENWAEMMEFWHCHKPVDHDKPDDASSLQHRGYGAASAITAQPGVGFVDITSFLFAESDCCSLKFSYPSSEALDSSEMAIKANGEGKFLSISCSNCAVEVGTFSILASTLALFKWHVSCEVPSFRTVPSSSNCLVATMLSTISRSGSSKSVVMPPYLTPGDNSTRNLQLWVLNNNVIYTSNRNRASTSAVKVLFKEVENKEALRLLESLSTDVQDISFPASAIQIAHEALMSSKYMLPLSERSFQEWQVGLLERWNPQPA